MGYLKGSTSLSGMPDAPAFLSSEARNRIASGQNRAGLVNGIGIGFKMKKEGRAPVSLCRRSGFGETLGLSLAIVLLSISAAHAGGAFSYKPADQRTAPEEWNTVVGFMQLHTVGEKETLLDIARAFGIGFNEIQILYPRADPWIPETGRRIAIPTEWILPAARHEGIVINLPEMRLYRFFPKIRAVKTYPIGVGAPETPTPEGTSRVVDRSIYPTWVIPDSLRDKYPVAAIPPGPENPLGKYWLGLSREGYGIHGTNFAWCVGRAVSNGCIRLYPEHIEQLYRETAVLTRVEIVYEPVKVGFRRGEVFVEVHPDLYGRVQGMEAYAMQRVRESVGPACISMELLRKALEECNGVPVAVGSVRNPGGSEKPLVWNSGQACSSDESNNGNHEREEEKG